ncbi:ferritin-2, chloroplastic [Senna tora]|uniref:Ferritin n=1 Tax=Senna tora TaxID=362788 RepID=A0A835CK40_9FABA|nr:ferritin-2, chloroplastic [Senna tora]
MSSGVDRPRARHTPEHVTQSLPSTCSESTVHTEIWNSLNALAPPLYFQILPFVPKMALAPSKVCSFSLQPVLGDGLRRKNTCSNSSLCLAKIRGSRGSFMVKASPEPNSSVASVIFEPFEEIKKDFLAVPLAPQVSMARLNYEDECEAALNEQINVEYNVSYVYHSMYAYFGRDNIALRGLSKFFKESSEEEREHAEKLMKYQNIRGGRVLLHAIKNPPSEFEHNEKGDALYAMELALSLEKLTNEKLLNVHSVADRNKDPELAHFIESEYLDEQVEAIKKIAEYVAQLRMVGKGHGSECELLEEHVESTSGS